MQPYIHYDPDHVTAHLTVKATARTLSVIASKHQQPMRHFDITAAFPHEKQPAEFAIFVRQPTRSDGTLDPPGKLGTLIINLYGSTIEGNVYTEGLYKHLLSIGFTISHEDPRLVFKQDAQGTTIAAIANDDFLVTATSDAHIDELFSGLRSKYDIIDLGTPECFLNWNVTKNTQGEYHISQATAKQGILHRMGYVDCHGKHTPLPAKPDFDEDRTTLPLNPKDATDYRSILGQLRYLADSTRLDIAFATSKLAAMMHHPTQQHQLLLHHLLRYLKITINHGIQYDNYSDEELSTYADAEFATFKDRKYYEGHLHVAFGAPVSWKARKQRIITLSTYEAEYLAAFHALRESLRIRRVLDDTLNLQNPLPTPFRIDNTAAIAVGKNTAPTKRRKHIYIKHHHLVEHHKQKHLTIRHIPLTLNKAHILTKSLDRAKHREMLQQTRTTEKPRQGSDNSSKTDSDRNSTGD